MKTRFLSLILSLVLILSIAFSAECFSAGAVSYNIGSYLKAYKSGNYSTANKIASKLPENSKNYAKKMSSKMKETYLRKVIDTKNTDTYCLCDVTGDKKPELFLRIGTCEADYRFDVFTYKKGKIKKLGTFAGGHCYLCDYPGKKAVLVAWGHMGNESLSIIHYKNKKFKAEHINGRYSGDVEYTKVPYALKYYNCSSYGNYELSPFGVKNTASVKKAKKNIKKLVNLYSHVVFKLYPKTKKIKLNAKNKTITATLALGIGAYDEIKTINNKHFVTMKKSRIKDAYAKLFTGKPSFGKLSSKYKKRSKNSPGNVVFKRGNLIYNEGIFRIIKGDYYYYSKNAKIECIRKIKGGYRVAVAHYADVNDLNNYQDVVCYAHSIIDVKKKSSAPYKFILKKIKTVKYIKMS